MHALMMDNHVVFLFERSSTSLFTYGLYEGFVHLSARWFVDVAGLCQKMPSYRTSFFYGVCNFAARHTITSCSLYLLATYPLIAPIHPALPIVVTILAGYVIEGLFQRLGKQVGKRYVHAVNTTWIFYKAGYLPLSIAIIAQPFFLRLLVHFANLLRSINTRQIITRIFPHWR